MVYNLYNIKIKKFDELSSQLICYSKPIFSTKSKKKLVEDEINEKEDLIKLVKDDVLKKNLQKRILNLKDVLNELEDEKKLCNLTDDEYNIYLKKTQENKIKYSLNNDIRAKKKIYDYARANKWEYFLTFTFNQNNVDRTNFYECKKKLSKWFNNISQRFCNSELKYLCIRLVKHGISMVF